MRTLRTMLMLTVLVVAGAAPVAAQSEQAIRADPLFSVLFPPVVIMQHRSDTLEGTRVDLDLALDQMDDVLETEKNIKQAHLELLVRIKNLMTPEQQAILTRLRESGGAEG